MKRLFFLAILFLLYFNPLSAQTADTLKGKHKMDMHSSLSLINEKIVPTKKDSHWLHPHWWCWKCWKRGAFSGKSGARPTKEQKDKLEGVKYASVYFSKIIFLPLTTLVST